METFTKPRELVESPHYREQRRTCLAELEEATLDAPVIELVRAFNRLPHCFTLQSCYGHFLYNGQHDARNLEPLPIAGTITRVEYRIAYMALCVENSASGKKLLKGLREVTALDPENIQFGSADWFWERQVNSYALQVEPVRFMYQDRAILGYREALRIEQVRDAFLIRLQALLQQQVTGETIG